MLYIIKIIIIANLDRYTIYMCSHIHTCNYVGQQGNTRWKVIARAKHQTIKPRHNSILQINTFELIVGITDELFSVNFPLLVRNIQKLADT